VIKKNEFTAKITQQNNFIGSALVGFTIFFFVLSIVNSALLVISLVRLVIVVVLNVGELRSVRCYKRGLQSQVDV
jgi:succinate-acetate transporter protein